MSNSSFAIFTEPAECQDCYKCLRECPVKAIRIIDNKASIIDEECIACGHCVDVCPASAKKVRNDVPKTRQLLLSGKKVILSVAPSWKTFFDYSEEELAKISKGLGFFAVSETAEGADYFSLKCAEFMENSCNPGISAACPTSVALIKKKYSFLEKYIIPVASPMILHSRLLKQRYGDDISVVFLGPCYSKKLESDSDPDSVFSALTFEEFSAWISEDLGSFLFDSSVAKIENGGYGAFFPVDGGICKNINAYAPSVDTASFSGIDVITNLCDNCSSLSGNKIFLELSSCPGSCVNGPSLRKKGNLLQKMNIIKNISTLRTAVVDEKRSIDIAIPDFAKKITVIDHPFKEIKAILESVGKFSVLDEKNCGGCGYSTCKEFAAAVLENKAEKQMCLSYLRRISEKKADALLKTMPSAVVIVDSKGVIVESNMAFAQLAGSDVEENFDILPGLQGMLIEKIVPFYDDFFTVLDTGINMKMRTWKINNRVVQGSIFIIEKKTLAGAIFQDITLPSVNRDRIIRQAQTVLEKNVQTVQQIAFLLGENASETEVILNSIVSSFSGTEGEGE
ncbi:MAG: 4Fe-4S dicluster domain-containing protein [Spirochaetales bacterium]|nr:4Fe-4S dicluster domain-containing protein [Spirochaetales bacterium]